MPRVSIIIPTYNREGFLPGALQSCLSQDFTDLEVLVVDDASTDGTASVVRSFADARVRYIRQGHRQGHVAAINRGMAMANGEFLTWSSDDDLYLPGAVARLVRELDQDPKTDFVYAHYNMIDVQGKVLHPARVEDPEGLDRDNYVGHCFLYRRKVYEALGDYSSVYVYTEEYEYWLRVREKFRMKRIAEMLYQHCLHSTSITMTHSEDEVQDMVSVVRKKFIPAWKHYFFLAERKYHKKDRVGAIRGMLVSLFFNPVSRASWRIMALSLLPGRVVAMLRKERSAG
ncbi:MAG: glycosyltransferase [Candidatus Omnitrophica bacterium]|nr:glycosyltransferase [Candidatus Omnitrophota bacterium]